MPEPIRNEPPSRPKGGGETLDESGALVDEDDGIPGAAPPAPATPAGRQQPHGDPADSAKAR